MVTQTGADPGGVRVSGVSRVGKPSTPAWEQLSLPFDVKIPRPWRRVSVETEEERIERLVASVPKIIDMAIRKHVTEFVDGRGQGRTLAGIVTMFSGGKDSTVLAHIMRGRTDCYGHANTGIGIPATRRFVRDTCREWGVPLLERSPKPDRTYEAWVSRNGFPGPGAHGKIYNRIKGSAFEQINAEMCPEPWRQRVLFVAGRRFTESARREQRKIPVWEQRKSVVWVSPLRGWTNRDLIVYRRMHPDVPRNPVAEEIDMSGECLCGAFARPGELDLLAVYPPAAEPVAEIARLAELAQANGVPESRCRWGWGARDRACIEGCNL